MAVHLTTDKIKQGSAGFFLRLDFNIDGFSDSYEAQTWRVKIVLPDGTILSKTSGLTFLNEKPIISVPIVDYDLVQSGTYYYQVTLTTGGANVNSSVESFKVESSLPEGLPYSVISSAMNYFPIFTSGGALAQSGLRVDGSGNLAFTGGAAFSGSVSLADEAYSVSWATKLEAATKKALYDKINSLSKADIGLGNVDNTPDASKPLSTAAVSALAGKENTITAGNTTQYWRGDKTWQTLNTAAVPESGNLYFTNARARAALSLTTTGTGTATYDNATGILNVPPAAATPWGSITGSISSQTDLQSALSGKENSIFTGTTFQYWRGDKSWQTLNTAVVPESGNLYYTNARARAAISLTTTGSGVATYDNSTGILNVPTPNSAVWGNITGTLSSQTDLQTALNAKGTFTLPTLTAGSVLFSDGTTVVQDNANFFWDNTTKFLKVGSPLNESTGSVLRLFSTDVNYGPAIGFYYNTTTDTGYKILTNYRTSELAFSGPTGGLIQIGRFPQSSTPAKLSVQAYNYETGGTAVTVNPGSATTTALVVKLAATPTADAFQVLASDGTTKLNYVDSAGTVRTAKVKGIVDNLTLQPGGTNNIMYLSDGADNSTAYVTTRSFNLLTPVFATTTPATITASQNDYLINNSTGCIHRISSDANYDITGIKLTFNTTSAHGQFESLVNVGNFIITLKHQSTLSTAVNRLYCSTGNDISLRPDESVDLIYDSTISRWRVYKKASAIDEVSELRLDYSPSIYNRLWTTSDGVLNLGQSGGTLSAQAGIQIYSSNTFSPTAPMISGTGGAIFFGSNVFYGTYASPKNATYYAGGTFTFQHSNGYQQVANLKANAYGFEIDAGSGYSTFFTGNYVGIGFNNTNPSAKLHVASTTEQLRLEYNTSNYFKTTVGSTGSTTFALTGTSPVFTFSQKVNVPDDAYNATTWDANTEVPTKNAIRDKIESLSFTAAWGAITGTLSAQTDLQTALNGKEGTIAAGTTSQYWRGDKSWQTLDKTAVGLSAVANALQLIAANNLSDLGNAGTARTNLGLGTAAVLNTGTSSGDIPILGAGGVLATSVLPPLAITSVSVVASQVAQLALTAQEGDVAVRTDLNKSYIKNAGTAGTMADWNELLTPTDAILSVNGYTGTVVLTKADVGLGSVSNALQLIASNNLSDLPSASTARTNLGLGTLATQSGTFSGTSSGTNTGDQTITLTSDVTGSGTGSFATTIAAGAVTLAKMANVATATVFYRKTAGTGVPEVQTLATLKTDLGLTGTNSGDQTISLTGDVTGSGTGSFAATLATVNSNVGTFNNVTVNAKGLVTAASNVAYLTSYTETSTLANVTGRGNTSSTGLDLTQNGNLSTSYALKLRRNTDTSSIGYFIQGRNTADNANLFSIDTAGNITGTTIVKSGGTSSQFLKADGSVDSSTYITGNQSITLSGAVTGTGSTAISTTLAAAIVGLSNMANVATGTIFYRKTAGTGSPEVQTLATLKTDLAITKTDVGLGSVENTALSTWAGTGNITTVGTISSGTWGGTTIAINKGGTGQTTAQAALDALLPTQTSNSGKFLTTNGTTSSWGAISLATGAAVTGGGANRVLFLDGSQNLSNASNFTFSAGVLTTGQFTATASTATGLDLATNNTYAEMRVMRNSTSSVDKNMYMGIGSGATSSIIMYANNSPMVTLSGSGLAVGGASFNSARMLEVCYDGAYQMRLGNGIGGASLTYDIGRNNGDGYMHFYGNQSGANGYIFDGIDREFFRVNNDGKFGIGTSGVTLAAKLHVIGTTEQQRLGYNNVNYVSTTVSSGGAVTHTAVGGSAGFTFSNPVAVPDDAYGSSWASNYQAPTKNAVYGRFNTVSGNSKYLSDYGTSTTAIANAIAAIGSTPTDLYVNGAFQTNGNHTFDDNTRLIFTGDGLITINSGHTVVVGLMYDPGNRKVFSQTDITSRIRFRRGAVNHMNVAWLVGGVGTDCTNAINEFLTSVASNASGTIYIPQGTWTSSGSHILPWSTVIEGAGIGLVGAGTTLRCTKAGTAMFVEEPFGQSIRLRNLIIDGNSLSNTFGFWFKGSVSNCAGTSFEGIKFMNLTKGLMMDGTASPTANVFGGAGGPWNISFIYLNSADTNFFYNPPVITVNSGSLTGTGTVKVVNLYGGVTRIEIPATITGGTFTISISNATIGTQTTSAIAYNATAATIQTALEALASVADTVATTGWQIAGITLDAFCLFENCSHSSIHSNTSNSAMLCEANFSVPGGAWAAYFEHCGATTFNGCEFAGNGAYGRWQIEQVTVTCPTGAVTATSILQATVATGGANFPQTVYIDVTTGDTPSTVARKVRDALEDNAFISYYFRIGGTGADVLLSTLDDVANNSSLNLSLATVGGYPACGVNSVATSTHVVSGVAASGISTGVLYCNGDHGSISFVGTQDEGFANSIVVDAPSLNQEISGFGALFQSAIRLNQTTRLNLFGCNMHNKLLRDGAGGSMVTSIGTNVISVTNQGSAGLLYFNPTLSNFSQNAGGSARVLMETTSGSDTLAYQSISKFGETVNITAPYLYEGTGRAALEVGAQGTTTALRIGTSTDFGNVKYGYNFRRETDGGDPYLGYLKISGTQAGYSGFVFNGPVIVPDDAYSSGWNGSLAAPTKNAVYDKIEAIGTRVVGTTSSATPTPNMDTTDIYSLTAQAASATFAAPTGTIVNGRSLTIRIKDNGTPQTLSWNSVYVNGGAAMPTTTVANKTVHVTFMYNTDNGLNKWMCLRVAQEA